MTEISKLPAKTETTGIADFLSSFTQEDSSPRIQMGCSQIQQATMPRSPDTPYILTGFEPQLLDSAYAVRMPVDAIVVRVISKYLPSEHSRFNKIPPTLTVVFQDDETGEYDFLNIEHYYKGHDTFAVKLHHAPIVKRLRPGLPISKGTILAGSAGVMGKDEYTSYLNAEVINLSIAGVTEDGFIVSDEFLERSSPEATVKCGIEGGKETYLLNIYGTKDDFRAYPEPGQKIREDNLVFAARKYDPILDAVNLLDDMMDVVYDHFDETVYAPGDCKDGVVYDLDVYSSNQGARLKQTPHSMEAFLKRHRENRSVYCDKLYALDKELQRKEGSSYRRSPVLSKLITEAMADKPNDPDRQLFNYPGTVQFTHKLNPNDEWRISIEISWRFNLTYGSKYSCRHGSKGVVCSVWPRADMPRNEHGDVADIVQYGNGVFGRMNVGQEKERYLMAMCRDIGKDVKIMAAENKYHEAFEHVMGFLKIASPRQHAYYLEVKSGDDVKEREFIQNIIKDKLQALIPPDEQQFTKEIMAELKAYRRPNYSRITYRGYDGQEVTTIKEMLIAPKVMMVLDKSSFKPMAVAVGQRQQHGLPSTSNKRTKVAYPTSRRAPRTWGEAEWRGVSTAIGGEAVAYIVDMSTNPEITKEVVKQGMNATHIFKTKKLIDRTEFPPGFNRAIGFIKNIFGCLGVEFGNSK